LFNQKKSKLMQTKGQLMKSLHTAFSFAPPSILSLTICLTLLYIKKQRGEIISRPYLYTVCIKLLTARRIFSETPCIFMYLATVEPLLPISRPTAA
ncbi:MAG: hypothetical protein U0N86_07950, partial [Lachnospiraceae bacterium]